MADNEFKIIAEVTPEMKKAGIDKVAKEFESFYKRIVSNESFDKLNRMFVKSENDLTGYKLNIKNLSEELKALGGILDKDVSAKFDSAFKNAKKAFRVFEEGKNITGLLDFSKKAKATRNVLKAEGLDDAKINERMKPILESYKMQFQAQVASLRYKKNRDTFSSFLDPNISGEMLFSGTKTKELNDAIDNSLLATAKTIREISNKYETTKILLDDRISVEKKTVKELKKQQNNIFKTERKRILASGTAIGKMTTVDEDSYRQFFSSASKGDVKNRLSKTRDEIGLKLSQLGEMKADSNIIPDEKKLVNLIKLISELRQKEAILKSIVKEKEKENQADIKQSQMSDDAERRGRTKGFAFYNPDEANRIKTLTREQLENEAKITAEKTRQTLETINNNKVNKNLAESQELALNNELELLKKKKQYIDSAFKALGKEKKVQKEKIVEIKKGNDLSEKMNELQQDYLKIGLEVKKLNKDDFRFRTQKIALLKREKDIENEILNTTDKDKFNLLKQELNLLKKITKQMNEMETAGNKTKSFVGHLRDAISNAFTFEKVLNRIAFVITAKLSYEAFDFLNQSLREGFENAVDLEAQLKRIESISRGQNQKPIEDSIKKIISMGATVDDASISAYQSISSQYTTFQTEELMDIANKMRVAGFSTQKESIDLLTSTLRAFGMQVSEATKVSDIFFKVVELGKTTIPELSQHLQKVSSTAKLLNIPFEEVATALATMTLNGIDTAQATTSLNQLFLNLVNPSKEAREIFAKHNITLDLSEIKTRGLGEAVKKLSVLKGEEMEAIASSRRGLKALAVAYSETEQYQENYNKIVNSSGATQKAFDEQMSTTSMQLQQLKGSFIEMGMQLGKVFSVVGKVIIPLFEAINKGGILWYTVITAGIAGGTYKAVKAIILMTKAMQSLDRATKLASASNLALIALTGTLIAVSAYLGYKKKKEELANKAEEDMRQRAIASRQKEITKLKEQNELLLTYGKLTEKNKTATGLSKTESVLLASTIEILAKRYNIAGKELGDYTKIIETNTKKQQENFKIIRDIQLAKIRGEISQENISGVLGEKGSQNEFVSFYGNTQGLKTKPSTTRRSIVAQANSLANILKEKAYSFNTEEDAKKIIKDLNFINKLYNVLSEQENTFYDNQIKASENNILKIKLDIDNIKKEKSLSKERGELSQEKYDKEIESKKIELEKAEDGIKKSKEERKEFNSWLQKNRNQINPDLQRMYDLALNLKPDLNTGTAIETQTDLLDDDKTVSFKHPDWITAKNEYKQQNKNLEYLLEEKDKYDKAVDKFYANDIDKATSLKESAQTEALNLIESQNKKKIKETEGLLKTSVSVEEYNKNLTELNKLYDKMYEEMKTAKASDEKLESLKDEKDARFGKESVQARLTRTIISRIEESEEFKEELELLKKKDPNSELLKMLQLMEFYTISELELFLANNSQELEMWKVIDTLIREKINQRKKVLDAYEESVASRMQGNFQSGFLGAMGFKKSESAIRIEEINKTDLPQTEKNKIIAEETSKMQMAGGEKIYSETENLLNATKALYDNYLNARLEQIEAEKNAKLEALDTQAKTEYRSTLWLESEKDKIEKKAEKERKKLNKERKASMIGEAIAGQALGITKIWANKGYTPVVASILTALMLAVTGTQIATIQKQKFAKGGIVKGKRHSQGGVPIEAEGNEMIFSRRATMGNESLLMNLNSALEGKKISGLTAGNISQKVINNSSSNTIISLEKQFEGLQKSIENIQMNVVLQGEFLSDIKLSKKVENGNRKRSVL